MTHQLAREVRFSVNPFLPETPAGFNSYSSKPAGDGLCLCLSLWVCLCGPIDTDTGFVVNVSEIDRIVRQTALPVLEKEIKKYFCSGRHTSISHIAAMLGKAFGALTGRFEPAALSRLVLGLNPFRHISTESEDCKVIHFSEKFEFAAMHTLWNNKFSREKNASVFGKCANPAGHGHNYIIEVSVALTDNHRKDFSIAAFEKTVQENFLCIVDHKNLNIDVAGLSQKIPTVENIAGFAWESLTGKFQTDRLKSVTVWENDRTYCTCTG